MAAPTVTAGRIVTRSDLRSDLKRMLRPGDTVLAHAVPRRIGRVVGGEWPVVPASRDVSGSTESLVAPAHMLDHDPSRRHDLEVSVERPHRVHDAISILDSECTPGRGLDAIMKVVRVYPQSVCGQYQASTFRAIGEPVPARMVSRECHSHLGLESEADVDGADFDNVGRACAAESANVVVGEAGKAKATVFRWRRPPTMRSASSDPRAAGRPVVARTSSRNRSNIIFISAASAR
ncbi:hypothetical protein WEI85_28805 [Actinomycetes bacterium KLBMP 9797]